MTADPLSLSLRRIARVKWRGEGNKNQCGDERYDGNMERGYSEAVYCEVYRQPFPTGHPAVYFPIPPASP